ncbi:MAG: THUMP domain-containing protein [Nitrospiraceae bacterium]|nr:THUMP domain-containing protein [Nitrospiraceae bacterium]
MRDWNVVAVIREGGFDEALRVLGEFGFVGRSRFYNVLLMKVADIRQLLSALRRRLAEAPQSLAFLSRILPVEMTFQFSTREEFESKAKESVLVYAGELGGKIFHVRIHRRGSKGRLSSPEEERLLDEFLLGELDRKGSPGRISFEDPDAVIAVETVENRAGVALWRREDLALYPFIRIE